MIPFVHYYYQSVVYIVLWLTNTIAAVIKMIKFLLIGKYCQSFIPHTMTKSQFPYQTKISDKNLNKEFFPVNS